MALVATKKVFVDMKADSAANTKSRNVHVQYSKKLNAGDMRKTAVREERKKENDAEKEPGHFGGKGLPHTLLNPPKRHFILYKHFAYHHFNISLCHTTSHQFSGDF